MGQLDDLRKQANSLEDVGGYVTDVAILQGKQGGKTLLGAKLTCNVISMLGVKPRLGRAFLDADCAAGSAPTVLLSEDLWRQDFGADPHVIGRQVRVGKVPHTVIGVMPARFTFPEETGADARKGIWLPSQITPEMRERGFSLYEMIGRLRPGVPLARARAELAAVAADIRKTDPKNAPNLNFTLVSYRDAITGSVEPVFLALAAALGLVLLIACANVANLQLSRCLSRYHELAVRVAMGAPKWRLVQELIAEGAVLSLVGALLGLQLAFGILWAVHLLPENVIPMANEIHLRLSVLAVLAGVAALTTTLSSLVPALFAMRAEPQTALRGAGRGVSQKAARSRMSGWLVVGEVALAAILLVACSLLFRTLYNLEHKSLGFEVSNLTTFTATPPDSSGYLSGPPKDIAKLPSIATEVYTPVLAKLRALPGVRQAALASSIPFDGVNLNTSFDLNGKSANTPEEQKNRHAYFRVMSGGYLQTMGTPIVRGRAISDDDVEGRPFAAVVNETFARKVLRGLNPIGQQLSLGGKDSGMIEPYTIVGVMKDATQKATAQPAMSELALSYRQIPSNRSFIRWR